MILGGRPTNLEKREVKDMRDRMDLIHSSHMNFQPGFFPLQGEECVDSAAAAQVNLPPSLVSENTSLHTFLMKTGCSAR